MSEHSWVRICLGLPGSRVSLGSAGIRDPLGSVASGSVGIRDPLGSVEIGNPLGSDRVRIRDPLGSTGISDSPSSIKWTFAGRMLV